MVGDDSNLQRCYDSILDLLLIASVSGIKHSLAIQMMV